MRIAYHNPWVNSSENQGYMSMAEAGRRIGVDLVACVDENDIEACRPDFVISVATSIAKITDYPTYLTVHEPKAYLFEQPARMRNLFSYDGYLTISDSLERFIHDFCHGVGRQEEPGFLYLTPQVNDLRCDWDRADPAASVKVVYFGTNWNRRMPALFKALDPMGILRLHGPEESWRAEGYASYAGPVAFDGQGPQRVYAECGIGLALMDERWQREDVISNRVFEISSVGAVSICPDMPWTRKWFGDCVLYFDPDRPMREIAEQVRVHHAFCVANPARARDMGQTARAIFEQHFSAERMLTNAVDYHHRKIAERARLVAAMPPAPEVTVVLRCGGRGLDMLGRAVNSIRRQSYGRFTVILAKYRDIDLAPLIDAPRGAIVGFDEVLIEGGNRAHMLFTSLRRITTPYFAVLDDDDFWLSDHIETLFRAGQRVRPDFDVAFSGSIGFDFPVFFTEVLSAKRNILRFGYAGPIADTADVQNAIGTNCFVARTDLLRPEMLQIPDMRTAEDSLLICLLAWRSKPIFSYRPTAFYRRDAADGSGWQTDPQRGEDEISYGLRAGMAWSPTWLASDSFALPNRVWSGVKAALGSTRMGENIEHLLIGDAGQRVRNGIAARPGAGGFVCYGPYIRLPPGRYMVTFLVDPEPAARSLLANQDIGTLDVMATAAVPVVLAEHRMGPRDTETTLRFTVDAGMADWRIEFRALARGGQGFTVTSVALYRDLGEPSSAIPPARVAAPAGVTRSPRAADPPDAGVAALRAELEALRNSTSWRVTAPLRRVGSLLHRRRQ